MAHRYWVWSVVVATGVLLVSGCSHLHSPAHVAARPADGPQKPGSEWPLAKVAEAHAHYAAAVIHEMNEEGEAALNEYYLAALNDPDNQGLILDVTRRFLQNKQPEKALDLLVQAAARPGASGAIYARLGMVYSQLGKLEQAASADRASIKRSPESLAGYQNLFLNYLQNKREQEALKTLDEAAGLSNASAEFLVGLAELYESFVAQIPSQKPKVQPKALATLKRAEKLDPASPLLRLRLADNFSAVGDTTAAAKLYMDLLKKLPDVPPVRERLHAKLATIYLQGSDRTNALEQLQAIIRDDPTNPQAYYYLGFLTYSEKRPAEAADYFSKAILLNPEFGEAYYDLALAQLALNKPAEALATLDKARGKFNENFVLEYYSGLASGEMKDYAAALRHYTAAEVMAKAAAPTLLDREFYFQLGACYERTGDYQHAEEYFQKCLEISADWPEALNYLGYMWAEHGLKLEQARQLIEKAVKAEPKNGAYLDSLAWVLFKQNQPEAALNYLQQAIEFTPKPDPTVYDHLGDIYGALQQMQKAQEAWEKSLSLEPNEEIKKKLETARGKRGL